MTPPGTDLALPGPETRPSVLAICRMTPEIEPELWIAAVLDRGGAGPLVPDLLEEPLEATS